MKLFPKKTKYRKQQKGSFNKKAFLSDLWIGNIGLYSKECRWLTAEQIETCRKTILKYSKKQGSIIIRLFPDKPKTEHPKESRMGSGKGSVNGWLTVIRPGRLLFELKNIPNEIAFESLQQIQYKLPIKTGIIFNI